MSHTPEATRPRHLPLAELQTHSIMIDRTLADMEQGNEINCWLLSAARRAVAELEGHDPGEASALLVALLDRLQDMSTLHVSRKHATALVGLVVAKSEAPEGARHE